MSTSKETTGKSGAGKSGAGKSGAGKSAAGKSAAGKAVAGKPLTGKQRRHLRGIAHHLDPIVQLGKQGLTDGAERAIDDALEHHELVKIKLLTECPEKRDELAERLAPRLKAEIAQTLGRTLLLYRRHPKKPVISLPKE